MGKAKPKLLVHGTRGVPAAHGGCEPLPSGSPCISSGEDGTSSSIACMTGRVDGDASGKKSG